MSVQDPMESKLEQIFKFALELPDDYADTASLRRVNTASWDSMAHVSIIAGIESEFGITLEPHEYELLSSFEAAKEMMKEKV